jgi:hypothetical protein
LCPWNFVEEGEDFANRVQEEAAEVRSDGAQINRYVGKALVAQMQSFKRIQWGGEKEPES